ncbi:DNA repair protein RecN [Desulfurivibrio alkaliphilus]|uniref:DNA repair protein RecN n=1 Tax=Desulfurivibrio alkaliphilus (strain DSM 19089 / UNIQEM U267 / AHT2) TaxID=589865 RepID=D6Z1E5_DESAT|nr:DNA repair protein RecN [Desulfurivibrio alkaliphilus]ADH85400.1 DNA repair protein RecN [Desulfurivibrio alkaliphilus AHT 2]
MLKELWIKNLALVEELRLSPGSGLAVLTGETGAGKSIILQAVHLLAGGRASADWVRGGAEQATVEAFFEFDPGHEELVQLLSAAGLELPDKDGPQGHAKDEPAGELIVKRIISAKGKSRFYLNGSMATAATVGSLVEHLVSVASQHDHQQLLQPRYHLECIDAAGNLLEQRQALAVLFDQWQEVKNRLLQLRTQEQDKEQRRDFLAFQCREIEEIAPEAGEDERLAEQKDRLKFADTLIDLGRKSYAALAEKIGTPLAAVRKNLQEMAARDEGIGKLAEDVAGAAFVLEDAQMELVRYLDGLPNDAAALDQVTARIDQLQKLKRKYGPTLEEVLTFARQARAELDTLENMDAALAELEAEVARREAELMAAAAELSAARRRVADDFVARVGAELSSLALAQARFAVQMPAGEPARITRLGWDKPEFVFSANPGEELRPLARVASGGELSRLMLALKCVLARQDKVESVVFDEVDAGISGQAAESVARKIRQLAGHHQVICITHLPQIAAGADEHYLVAKSQRNGRTITEIDRLPEKRRPHELARMLDGAAVSDKTLAYATELINRTTAEKKQLTAKMRGGAK